MQFADEANNLYHGTLLLECCSDDTAGPPVGRLMQSISFTIMGMMAGFCESLTIPAIRPILAVNTLINP
jgi:hypothetical protein